jgi:alpha-N-arabinofuranosidase
MKTPALRFATILLLAPLCLAAGTARITFDTGDVIDRVDPRIYGVFMEPIGFNRPGMKFNTLYGPLYEPGSPLADELRGLAAGARRQRMTEHLLEPLAHSRRVR